jgi:hypothetical protein
MCLCIVGLLCVLYIFSKVSRLDSFSNTEQVADSLSLRSLGYPLTQHFMNPKTISLLHLNASGQVPNMGNWGLIDWDTPKVFHLFAQILASTD